MNRLRWVYCDASFERRLQAEILNIVHMDNIAFFDDALSLFRKCIRDALNKLGVIKVYTELGA